MRHKLGVSPSTSSHVTFKHSISTATTSSVVEGDVGGVMVEGII